MRRLLLLWILGSCLVHGQSPGLSYPATDDLGRALPTHEQVGNLRPDKTVALFYWTWHVSQSVGNRAYNLSKIIAAGDPAMVNDYNHPLWAPYGTTNSFLWNEPIFDHYDGKDKWVIRKQLEMLGDAGVDVLFYDTTNGNLTFKAAYDAVGEVMAEARADGVKVPQFGFMLNFGPVATTVEQLASLYDDIYSTGRFEESWFKKDGKPVIMAYPEVLPASPAGDTASLKFTASGPFNAISVRCPSWANNIGDLTLSLYSWNRSLQISVAAEPVASQAFVNFSDNAYLKLNFSDLPAGDYVWRLHGARETVGVWKFNNNTATTESWFKDDLVTGDYDCRIDYAAGPTNTALTTGTTTTAVRINENLVAPPAVPPADSASLKFTAGGSFTGISVRCPSYANNIGDLTLSLHSWNTSLETSVAAAPAASKRFVNFADGALLRLDFAALPAGDYVWRLQGARETVGVWKFTADTATTESWFKDVLVTGDYDCRIHYAAGPASTALTTGTTSSAVRINAVVMTPARAHAIRSIFTFRPGQPAYQGGPTRPDQWGWLENYPQNGYVQKSPGKFELVTVGVAQNWSEQSNGLSAMNGPQIRGRSYTKAAGFSLRTPTSYLHGYNFQEQWERALQIDPDIVFITGWNEWVVGRYPTWQGVSNGFPDAFDLEHSRDIEPTKSGGYGDNYYYQMAANIRRFKGMAPPELGSAPTTIIMDGAFTDWAAVAPEFTASKGNVKIRNGQGYLDPVTGQRLTYQNNTARNDIIGAKVARDSANVFFLVETANSLSPITDPNWMHLLIDRDRNKATGWEGYEFRVDRYAANGKATLSSSTGAWAWTDLGEVNYQRAGARMEIAIPRALLGLQPNSVLNLEFKWIDSPAPPGDIMDVYVNGDAAPSGRFNFHYREVNIAAPVAVAQSVSTNEDTALPIVLTGTDADSNWLTYTVVSQPANGTLSGTVPNLTYTPSSNFNGADSFTFKVNDGFVDSAIATISITINPVVDMPSTFSPADNAASVAVTSNLVATFSEAIAIGSGNITIKNLTDGTQTTIAVTDTTQISISGAVLTINPTADLQGGKNYAVQIAATAIDDTAGNSFAGITNDTTWNFATQAQSSSWSYSPWTGDVDSGITSASPYTVAVNFAGTAATVNGVTFQASALTGTNFSIGGAANNFTGGAPAITGNSLSLASTFIFNASPRTVTLTNLTPGETYETSLFSYGFDAAPTTRSQTFAAGSDSLVVDQNFYGQNQGIRIAYTFVADSSGSKVLTITAVAGGSFHMSALANRQVSATPPTISSYSPADNATTVAVGANLVATFSEAIAIGTGNITLKNLTDGTQATIAVTDATQVTASGAVLTINPTTDLLGGKNYAIQIAATAVRDLANNAFAGIANDTAWNFATALPFVWTQTAGNAQDWTMGTNWLAGIVPSPIAGDTVDFSSANIAANTTLTFGANRTAQLWKFGDTSGTQNWTINAGNQMILAGTTPTIEVKQNTTTLNNVLAGTSGLTKNGIGTLVFSGTSNNTFTGGINLNAGTIQYDSATHPNAWGDSANVITFTGTATLHNNSNAYTLARGISINGGLTATLSGAFGESTNVTGVTTGTGTLAVNGGSNGWALTLSSTGNTFSGPIAVSNAAGVTSLSVASLGDVSATSITLGNAGNGADFTFAGGSAPLALQNRQFVWASTTGGNAVARIYNNSSGSNILTIAKDLSVTAGGDKTFTLGGSNTGNNAFNGLIPNGPTGVVSLFKAGGGKWILSNTNTYSGATTISGGKLFINGDQTAATGALSISANATLGGTGTIGGATTIASNGKLEFHLSTNAASHDKLALAAGKALVFSGASTLTITTSGGASAGDYTLVTAPGGFGSSVVPATVILPAAWTADAPRFVGTDLKINITSTPASTVAPDPFAAWAVVGVAFDADSNNDGVKNGLAWLLSAANSSENALNKLPLASRNGNNLRLTFRCLKSTMRGGAVLKLQFSTDMGLTDPWDSREAPVPDVDGTVNGVTFDTTDDGDFIKVIADIPSAEPVTFTRLCAISAPSLEDPVSIVPQVE